MATPKLITGLLKGPDDLPRAGWLTVKLSQVCIIPGTQETLNGTLNYAIPATGIWPAVSLYSNNDLTPTGTYYTFTEGTLDGAIYVRTGVIPQTAGPFAVTSIETSPPTVGASPNHVSTLTVDALTATEVVYADTAGLLATDPSFTFNKTTKALAATSLSAKDYDQGGAFINLAGPKYRAIGTWDPAAGTGDCLAALNQAILDGLPLLPPGTYNISGAPTNANQNPLLMIGLALFSGAGAAATTANIIRLGTYTYSAIYVASTGSDTNTGTAASPFLTLQRAINVAKDCVGVGVGVGINVASGSYVGFSYSSNGLAFNSSGNGSAPPGIVLTGGYGGGTTTITKGSGLGCVTVGGYGAAVTLQGTITFTSTSVGLYADQGGLITLNSTGITFGACTLAHMHADRNSMIQIGAGYTISGNATVHLENTLRGFIGYNEVNMTVTLTGSPVFSVAFALAQAHGTIYIPSANITFSGAAGATTVRFWARDNSLLETNAGLATFLPGTSPGQCTNGGRYMPMPTPVLSGLSGAGATATIGTRGGSNDFEGVIEINNSGAGAGTSCSFTITPGTAAPNQMSGVFILGVGSAAWSTRAVVTLSGTLSLQAVTVTIDNNAVTIPAGTLEIYYRLQAA